MHSEAVYITDSPKVLAMMQGIDDSFDAAIFLGYHLHIGKPGILNHVFHGGVDRNIRVNGIGLGEIGLNSLIAGQFGVSVPLVTVC